MNSRRAVAAAAQAVETAKNADQVKVTGLGTPNAANLVPDLVAAVNAG